VGLKLTLRAKKPSLIPDAYDATTGQEQACAKRAAPSQVFIRESVIGAAT